MTHFKPKSQQSPFAPVVAAITGLSSVNKTVNRLLTELVEHHRGRTKIPEGNALSAVAQNLPWLPTDSIVLFLAKPHSPWVEHVVVLDPKTRETILDQNPYLKISWDRDAKYEALLPGGRISTFVPLREITVDEIIRQGGLHYEIKKLQVNMRNKQQDMENVRKQNTEMERTRLRHFWPMQKKDDPRVKRVLPKEGLVPRLVPMPNEDENEPQEPPVEHFAPMPKQVEAPNPTKETPLDEETIRKMNRLKEIDDITKKEEEVDRIKDEVVREQEELKDTDEEPTEDTDKEPENTDDDDNEEPENTDDDDNEEPTEDTDDEPEDDPDKDVNEDDDEQPLEDTDETNETEQEKNLKNEDIDEEPEDNTDEEDEDENDDAPPDDEDEDEGEKQSDDSDDTPDDPDANKVKLRFESIKDMSDQELEAYFRHLIELDDEGENKQPEDDAEDDAEEQEGD